MTALGEGTDEVKAVGPVVVARTFQALRSILADAVADQRLARNPTDGVKLPRRPRKHKVYLTHDQVAELAHAAAGHEALILLLAYTGLRWGEAIGLRVAIWTCCAAASP